MLCWWIKFRFDTSWSFWLAGNTGTVDTRATATSFPSSSSHLRTRLPSTFERAETNLIERSETYPIAKTYHIQKCKKRRRQLSHVWVRTSHIYNNVICRKTSRQHFQLTVAVVTKMHNFKLFYFIQSLGWVHLILIVLFDMNCPLWSKGLKFQSWLNCDSIGLIFNCFNWNQIKQFWIEL